MIELNKVLLLARLTRDPETKYLPSGSAVCEMRVASDRSYFDRNSNDRTKETLFISVTAWGKTAEFCQQYMRKGSAIFVEGRLKLDSWKDQNGNNREKISIVADRVSFGETKAEAEARAGRSGSGGGYDGGYDPGDEPSGPPPAAAPRGSAPPPDRGGKTEDDLPF